jgi:hypothetical protein
MTGGAFRNPYTSISRFGDSEITESRYAVSIFNDATVSVPSSSSADARRFHPAGRVTLSESRA